ncbi:TetR/AcrR family transcriptional regulator C-terminal domain-containing protein [Actinoplanes sp. NPDC051411]|uniref:TetR/AcrR family transcriptional regulator C-terminal domain-containing protein n=1 Tax=Actinoplanes sp. NPDC051411 TaxID=3155522 RepID=UPI00342B7EC3
MPRRSSDSRAATRAPSRLSREGIVAAAVELADRDGLDGLSMRRLAQHLGVDAMSIYYHVHDKKALLGAMADAVAAEIPQAPAAGAWTARLRALIIGARRVMLRHPWAVRVFTDRATPTPAVLLHIERVLAVMRTGGCSVDLGHHAIHLLGSRILGFSQDLFDDAPAAGESAPPPPEWAETLPHVVELAAAVTHDGALSGCDDEAEFAFGLDLLIDGLERRRGPG